MVSQYKTVTARHRARGVGQEAQAVPVRRADRGQHHRDGGRAEERPGQGRPGALQPAGQGQKLELDSTVVYAENLKTNTTTPKDRPEQVAVQHLPVRGPAAGADLRAGQGGAAGGGRSRTTGKWLYFVDGQLRHRRDQVRQRPRPSSRRSRPSSRPGARPTRDAVTADASAHAAARCSARRSPTRCSPALHRAAYADLGPGLDLRPVRGGRRRAGRTSSPGWTPAGAG